MRLIELFADTPGTPVVPLLGYPGVIAAGHSITRALTDRQAHLESLALLAERFAPPCLFFVMDLTVEAEALGLPVTFAEGAPPSVAGHPVATAEDLAALPAPDPSRAGRMPLFGEVVAAMRTELTVMAGAYCIGPFTLAAELVGAEELAVRTLIEPEFAAKVIDFCAGVCGAYAGWLAERGAQVIAILEPTAVILSPDMFEQFCIEPLSDVAAAIAEQGAFPLLHICGDSTHLLRGMAQTGVDGLSLDSPVDLADAFDAVPADVLVIGNVDPVAVMLEGDATAVTRAAKSLLARFGEHPNFVLSSGCDLPPETPLANIAALMAAGH